MIEYKGMKLEEFTSDKPVVFDEPRKSLLWDNSGNTCDGWLLAYIPGRDKPAISKRHVWVHCAILPPPRIATNRELQAWCAQGKGQVHYSGAVNVHSFYSYQNEEDDTLVTKDISVRKWGDTVWHEPTTEYLGLTE